MVRARRAVLACSVGAAALVLVACGQSGNTVSESAPGGQAFADRIGKEIEGAKANGASANQLALLERARADGEVTIEMARQARRAYAECAAAAGVPVTFEERTRPDGWVSWLTMVEGATNPDALQIARDCEAREAVSVLTLYTTQPSATKASGEYLDQQAPVLRACLEAAGFQPEPDANGLELAILSTRADNEVMQEAGAMCLHEIGVDGF